LFEDSRGNFSETYNKEELERAGISCSFIQDNQSLSLKNGTVRGLHFQKPPFAQSKLVRVIKGTVIDVIVDLRKESATYLKSALIELSAQNRKQIFVPEGFAHGFCTLEDNTIVSYKVSAPYSKPHDAGIFWNDPDLGIEWPVESNKAILSEKDQALPTLKEFLKG